MAAGHGLEHPTLTWDNGGATKRGLEPGTSMLDSIEVTGGEIEPLTFVLVTGGEIEPLTFGLDKGGPTDWGLTSTKGGLEPGTSMLDSMVVTVGEIEPVTFVLDKGVLTDWGLTSGSPKVDKCWAPLGRLEPLTSTGGNAAVTDLGLELAISN